MLEQFDARLSESWDSSVWTQVEEWPMFTIDGASSASMAESSHVSMAKTSNTDA